MDWWKPLSDEFRSEGRKGEAQFVTCFQRVDVGNWNPVLAPQSLAGLPACGSPSDYEALSASRDAVAFVEARRAADFRRLCDKAGGRLVAQPQIATYAFPHLTWCAHVARWAATNLPITERSICIDGTLVCSPPEDGAEFVVVVLQAFDACALFCDSLRLESETPRAANQGLAEPTNARKNRSHGKRATVNQRMASTIMENPAAMEWNSARWAKYLKCAKSSVVETVTWKKFGMNRAQVQAQRATDRRRRSKPVDWDDD